MFTKSEDRVILQGFLQLAAEGAMADERTLWGRVGAALKQSDHGRSYLPEALAARFKVLWKDPTRVAALLLRASRIYIPTKPCFPTNVLTLKSPDLVTVEQACELVGISKAAWRTRMWAFLRGDPRKGTRHKTGWMPTPIVGTPFSNKALFRREDVALMAPPAS